MNSSWDEFSAAFKKGEMVMVFDEHREVEGDFFLLADFVTPEKINFLLSQAKGMICVACDSITLDRLSIPLMVPDNNNPHGTNFCVSVDAKKNITTGVSAFDRAQTIRLLADKKTTNDDFVIPGHTFPLRAVDDFSTRFGHTECAVGLAKKLNENPVVVICEILNEVGEKATQSELQKMALEMKIESINLAELRKLV